jgi:hypothetical protein
MAHHSGPFSGVPMVTVSILKGHLNASVMLDTKEMMMVAARTRTNVLMIRLDSIILSGFGPNFDGILSCLEPLPEWFVSQHPWILPL